MREGLLVAVVLAIWSCAVERARAPMPTAPVEAQARPGEDGPVLAPRRGLATRLDDEPVVAIPRSHPRVGKLRGKGSLSIGTTRDGFIVDCRLLPESDHLKVLEVPRRRGTNCGTDELVEALVEASLDVARASPGAVLTVGNMGRVGGGDIIWSVSHNSGRDVDIGFYLRQEDGSQYIPPVLVHVDRRGMGEYQGVRYRLDVQRTWLMVKSLLTNPKIEVQWMFVSDGVKRLLLEYAKKKKEPKALLEKAQEAMARPRGLPHNDHIHLRIYCPVDDLYEGCQDKGTNRPWFVDRTERVDARQRELLALLKSPDPTTRADAATVLGRLGRDSVLPKLLERLEDTSAEVRIAAARAIRELGVGEYALAVEKAIGRVQEDEAVLALLQALEKNLPAVARAAAFGRLLSSDRRFKVSNPVFETEWQVGAWALEALCRLGGVHAVETLVINMPRAAVGADAVNRALMWLTGHECESGDLHAAWQAWWARNKKKQPWQWYEEALGAQSRDSRPDTAQVLDILRKGDYRTRAALWVLRSRERLARIPPDGMEPLSVLVERAMGGQTVTEAPRSSDPDAE